MKAEVEKLDINKLLNVPTSLNNLKIKVDDLDVGKWKNVSVDLIHINQYNTDKQNLGKKMEMLIKNTRYNWFSDYNRFECKN